MPISVFIDTANIHQHATPLRWGKEERTVEWGDEPATVEVTVPVPAEDRADWVEEEMECLPGLADLVREGRVDLYEGVETRLEAISQYAGDISGRLGNPFAGLETKMVDDPLYDGRVVVSGADDRDREEFLETDHDATFSAMKNNMGNMDAYHVLSAERAGVEHFLTLDKNLRDAVREHVDVGLDVEVVLPCELLEEVRQGDSATA